MSNGSKSTASAARVCRSAFLTAITFRNDRWKLDQLRGLYQLLLNSREELISALAEGLSLQVDLVFRLILGIEFLIPIASYEREYTVALQDIAFHYLNIVEASTSSEPRLPRTASLRSIPLGVSLILTKSNNPFRYALAPLAASIAAGNTVVLATSSKSSRFFTLLSEIAGLYLDSHAIHIIQGLALGDPIFNEVDHVYILGECSCEVLFSNLSLIDSTDEQQRPYSDILCSHSAAFHSTVSGFNIVVVDEGGKTASEETQKIYRSYMLPRLAPERLDAVCIQHRDSQTFAESFSKTFKKRNPDPEFDPEKLTELGIVAFAGNSYKAELSNLVQSSTRSKSAIVDAIRAADRAGVLLVLLYTSFEQVMDGISGLGIPPLQVALLAPASDSHVRYVEKWTRSKAFSVGSIRSVIPPGLSLSLDLFHFLIRS